MAYLNSNRAVLRAGVAGAALAAMVAIPERAEAAIVNSVTNIQATPIGTSCRISWDVNITGNVNDSTNIDFYSIEIASLGGGTRVATAPTQTATFGTTATYPAQIDATVAIGTARFEKYIVHRDVASGSSPIISQVLIPDNVLVAAGGSCLNLRPNNEPVADAGPDQTVPTGSLVTLSGVGTDIENDPLSFQWTQVGGPSVTLNNPSSPSTSFTAPPALTGPLTLTFQLIADDGVDPSAPDLVVITVDPNAAPTVNAGPDQTVSGGSSVSLSGSFTDPENDPVTVQWTQTSGPNVTLNGANTTSPSFTAPPRGPNPQVLTFQIVATDSNNNASAPDTVEITVEGNQAPSANPNGPTTASGGATIQLDGSGSTDPEDDPLIYQWTQVSGPTATIVSPGAAITDVVLPPATGSVQTVEFQLLVADTFDATSVEQITVQIAANNAPVADAGQDQTVQGGSTVQLNGSGSSDSDNDPITYSWIQSSGPPVALDDATAAQPTFTAPAATGSAQTLVFDLVVSDGIASSVADQVIITIAANRPPVADAGPDQGPIDSGSTVRLDGTGSSDPDGDGITYSWTQVSGTSVTLSGANTAAPSFTAPVVAGNEDLVFQLIVSDGQVSSVADTVTISVRAVGTITIVQQVLGSDTSIAYTSSLAALTGSIATSNGAGQLSATNVAVGSYTITAADLSAQGYALTDISCNDSDSTPNLASRSVALELSANEDLVCTFSLANTREAATAAIAEFLTGRNALILSHQPDLQRRIDRLNGVPGRGGSAAAFNLPVPGSGNLPLDFTIGEGRAQASTSLATVASALGARDKGARAFDLWGELYMSNARIGSQEGSFRIGYVGADYRIGDSLLIGALVAFDEFDDSGALAAGEAEGDGWMAGPYIMAKLGEGFYAEGRAAWGGSDNVVSPLGTYRDAFDTNRGLYSGSLIGEFDLGDATTIRPEVTVRYIREEQKAYVDSFNVTIPSQVVDQGDVSFRPRVSHLVDLDSGWSLRPYGEVEGILTFGEASGFAISNFNSNQRLLDLGGLRARVEGGVDLFSPGGLRASISAFHDGIGADNFSSTGVHLGVSFGF